MDVYNVVVTWRKLGLCKYVPFGLAINPRRNKDFSEEVDPGPDLSDLLEELANLKGTP